MDPSDRDRAIDDLLDREAIRELPVRYCHCVRTRNLEAMLDLFAAKLFDGRFELALALGQGRGLTGIMLIDDLLDGDRAGHRRFLAEQGRRDAERIAGDMPQRLQQGRPDMP